MPAIAQDAALSVVAESLITSGAATLKTRAAGSNRVLLANIDATNAVLFKFANKGATAPALTTTDYHFRLAPQTSTWLDLAEAVELYHLAAASTPIFSMVEFN